MNDPNKTKIDFIMILVLAVLSGAGLKGLLAPKGTESRTVIKNILAGIVSGGIVVLFYLGTSMSDFVALCLAVLVSSSITALYPIIENWWLRFAKKYLNKIDNDTLPNN